MTYLVLDVGGVLMKLGGMATLLEWTGLTPQTLKSRWLASPVVVAFETGQVTFEDFAPRVIDEFNLPVSPRELEMEMRGWMGEPYEGAAELLSEVAKANRIAFLCNLNEVLWPVVEANLQPSRWSNHVFLSHRIGLAKPDPEVYRYVEAQLGTTSASICFFDDSQENVDAALASGWTASRVEGVEALKDELVAGGWYRSSAG